MAADITIQKGSKYAGLKIYLNICDIIGPFIRKVYQSKWLISGEGRSKLKSFLEILIHFAFETFGVTFIICWLRNIKLALSSAT